MLRGMCCNGVEEWRKLIMKNSSLNAEKGFSLIEVLIAVFILLIIVIAFTTLFTSSFRGITSSGSRSEKLFILQKNIESDINDLENAEIVGNVNIEFNDGVIIPGEHRAFKQDIDDQKEVVIDVFVYKK
jgi:prepilin-type N-terminal cleavage/methylation domain-containing protein